MNEIVRIKCVLLGDANAGKSALLQRYIKNEFTNKSQSTIGCSFNTRELEINNKIVKLDIWDTAGEEKYRSLLPLYYRAAKLVLLCFDLSVYNTALNENIKYWLSQLKEHTEIKDRLIFFVGTKTDIKCNEIDKQIEELQHIYPSIIYIETSSKEDVNINHLFEYSVKSVLDTIKFDNNPEVPFILEDKEVGCFRCTIS